MTPLHIASRCNHIEVIRALVPHCNINAKDQWGFTPLHYAVISRHKEVVMCLLEHGCVAAVESANGSTPLDIAKSLGEECHIVNYVIQ